MDAKETFWEGVDTIILARDRHTGCEHGIEPSVFVKWKGISCLVEEGLACYIHTFG
jgi:hypothetical protein